MNTIRAKVVSTRVCPILFFIAFVFQVTPTVRGQNQNWFLYPPPLFPTNEWGVATNSCQLGLRLPKFEYQSGEQLLAAAVLRNVGDKVIGYVSTGEYLDYEVTVRRSDGGS